MEKLRKDIEEQYKWDLTVLYKDIKEWEKDYNSLKEYLPKISKYKGHLLDDAKTLLEFMRLYYELDRKLEKVYYYAHLNYDADTTSSLYQSLSGKMDLIMTDISVELSFVDPELLKGEYSTIEKFYEEEPELREYEKAFIETFRYKAHTLTEAEEKIISKLSNSLSSASDIYEKLTDSDLTFGKIKDEKGNEVQLTDSNYSIYIRSNDRRVRKDAFDEMYKTYKSILNTTSATLYSNTEMECTTSKLRNYPNALEASLYADNVSSDIYNNLIDTVHKNMNVVYKYFELKRQELGLDKIHLYDIYANMVNEDTKSYTFDEAKNIVLDVIKLLGDKYYNDAKQAFDQRWIDIYPNKGKRGGAYSSGGYDTYPYMLLNFEGNLNDISTLIHELGHSMHSYYSKNNNKYQEYNYKIFVAEVASTTNELLLYKYLLKNTDDKNTKLTVLNGLMDLFKGTIFRQTMFAEFEKITHELVEEGEVLTPDLLCEKYYELNKLYFGENVEVDDEIRYEWARIPHFYYNFYVYKYATSLAASCYIATKIFDGDEETRKNYLKFLTLGGSMYPVDELKVAGVDMTNPEVIKSAIDMFDEIIEEYKNIK